MSDTMTQSARSGVLERSELILRCVAEAQVIGASELARATGLAKTTSYRLALDLVRVGLLERAGDGFKLGYLLFELGSRVMGPRHLREAAMPLMEKLVNLSGQTAHLAVVRDNEVSYVERVSAIHPATFPSAVAARLPLHCTATGKCFLAFGAADFTAAVRNLAAAPFRRQRLVSYQQLQSELASIVSDGVAYESGEVVDGVTSVAAPVFGLGESVEAAISVTGFDNELNLPQATELVRLAADALSSSLGRGGPRVQTA